MKIVLGSLWAIIISLISLLIDLFKTKKVVFLSLCSLILLIALNLDIKVLKEQLIYIPSILITLIIYDLLINKVKVDKKYNKLFIYLYFIYAIYLFQMIFGFISNYQLFVANLSYFLVIGLLLRYFINISKFQYKESYIFSLVSTFSLCNSILGILQFVFNKTLFIFLPNENINYAGIVTIRRAVGLIGASNGAGNLGAILLPVVLFYFLKDKSIYKFIVLILDALFTILTFTRIAYVAIIVELIIFFILGVSSKKLSSKVTKCLIIIIMILLSIFVYDKFFDNIYHYLIAGRGNTQRHRITQFKFIINEFINHPFLGVGSGQYASFHASKLGRYDLSVHSQYMNILIEQGIISFISFMSFNIYAVVLLLKKFDRSYKCLILSLFIGNLIVINFNPNQYYALNIYLYYFIVFGLMFSSKEKEK